MWFMPFQCAPVSTVAVTAQKLITALANVFQVVVVAEFLDGAIEAVVNRRFDKGTVIWFFLMILIVSWKRVSFHIGNIFTNHVTIHGNEQISAEITGKRDRMEYYLLEDPKIEELSNRLTGKLERNLQWNLQWFLNLFAINIPRIAGVLLIMAGYVWWLSLVVLALTVPLFLFSLKSGKKVYRAFEEAAVYERRHKYLFTVLTGRETTEERSLFGYTGQVNGQWHEQYEKAVRQDLKSELLFMGNSLRGIVINGLLSMIVVLIMIPLTASGKLTAGIFISLATSMYDLIDIMGYNTSRAVNQMAVAQEYMKDFTAFAALPERDGSTGGEQARELNAESRQSREAGLAAAERKSSREAGLTAAERKQIRETGRAAREDGQDSKEGKEREKTAQGEVPRLEVLEFCHVTFRYPGADADILKDFSMKLENGRHYAVVGENGAGKTTLVKLLTGLYREYEGEILYNGMEMRTFSREEWFRIFSCVFQDFARYYLSVEENICLGMGGMDFEEHEDSQRKEKRIARMEGAAKQMDIHESISGLKHGYETRLGKLDEDSVDLSGGQWQRVAMARALMNDAPLLLLDEPTAALDPISESRLYEEFGEISKNRTTIFISHRLGSIKLSDHIFLLKDGCVKEQGSHEELMALHGIYANMYETQQSWYNEEKDGDAEMKTEETTGGSGGAEMKTEETTGGSGGTGSKTEDASEKGGGAEAKGVS
jgi:ATP-binding cassette subfamily B protein